MTLDDLIDEITTDAEGDHEQLWAFRQAFEDEVPVPTEASVAGQPVTITKFDFDGNERRGLTATCRLPDQTKFEVAACDVLMPPGSKGARHVAAYRKWMGLAPIPKAPRKKTPPPTSPPSMQLAVRSVRGKLALCRDLSDDSDVTLRLERLHEVVPGEIAVVIPMKRTDKPDGVHIQGRVERTFLDAVALGLSPLSLEPRGIWNPKRHYWGEPGDPIEAWARPIIKRGPRPAFEMEQVLPGTDFAVSDYDPIIESSDLRGNGDSAGARKVLMDLCAADLRCLDAHAHLGNMLFDRRPELAIRHYDVGVRIGELTMKPDFEGLLPWGWIDNRPFLRCLYSWALCLWRLERYTEAEETFKRILWLNPTDNQGARFVIKEIRTRIPWKDRSDY